VIDGRITFSYNLFFDQKWLRNTHTWADWLWSYRHCIYGSQFCSPLPNTVSRVEREETSGCYWHKTYRIGGYYTHCESWNDNAGSKGTVTYVGYKVESLSYYSPNPLRTTTWYGSMICIKYTHVQITTLYCTLPWCTCCKSESYWEAYRISLPSVAEDVRTSTMSSTVIQHQCCNAYWILVLWDS